MSEQSFTTHAHTHRRKGILARLVTGLLAAMEHAFYAEQLARTDGLLQRLDPEVLLLDEPTTALDPQSQSQMIDFLVGWGGGAKTVVTATHDLDIVEDIAEHCYILQEGRIVAGGTPIEVLRNTPLLHRTRLIHAHRHSHAPGDMHSHPHLHRHQH